MLRPGTKAPVFELMVHTGESFRLSDLIGKNHLVLFFYPRDFTYGCTREVCGFRDYFDDAQTLGSVVLGVSRDTLKSHEQFAGKYALPFLLASDPDLDLARMYDAIGLFGFTTQRVSYVIDRAGIIRGAFHHEIMFKKHWRDTLDLLKSLNGTSP